MRVLISPSYGHPETRRHWADTVDRQVDFTVPRHDRLLAADQRAQPPTHGHVRQALAQLLDYAPHSPVPAQCLAALFPEPPEREDIELLHRYGIDSIHRERSNSFRRLPAPSEGRALMRGVWTGRGDASRTV
ncbi:MULTISPECIES: hypothetical protein [Streptomyces]|uniref:DUF4158 domain-containing protein n=1 Tax=Streptomyces dengpaensis TaxID=2049881 RepID=A0ABN5I8A0_9ACTN|nr:MULTISPECIES: hypothetical protein [Streptomyces]AVH59338.1 hypothetical protein C4B68_30370 [Streptomyces dengpaensis]PIB05294.1 hypothetical protein B1C81_29750 [Streptomyces sp. HG99]